jgi:hypothetical protein
MTSHEDKAASAWKGLRKAALDIAVVGFFFVLLGQAASLSLSLGLPWKLLHGRYGVEMMCLQKALFEADFTRPYEFAAIGDKIFLDRLRAKLPQNARIFQVEIPRVVRDSILSFLSLENLSLGTVFIQNMPEYWTDADNLSPSQDTSLWLKYHNYRFSWFPKDDLNLLFDSLENWAKGLEYYGPVPSTMRNETIFNADWDFVHRRKQFADKLTPQRTKHIYWINDLDRQPADMLPAIMPAYEAVFRSGVYDPELGNFADFEDVPGILHKMEAR